MSAVQGIRAGRAFVEFFADSNPFVRGLRMMEGEFKAWGSRLTKIGASLTSVGLSMKAALASAVAVLMGAGVQLSKMSATTGASVKGMSELGYAAQQCGASMEDVHSAIGTVNASLVAMARGNWEAGKGFAQIGLNAAFLARLRPEERFAVIAQRLSLIKNPALQAAYATEVFGGAAESLLPLIQQGAKGMADLRQRANDLGITMDGKTAAATVALSSALGDVWAAIRGISNTIAAAFAPEITGAATMVADVLRQVNKWVKANFELVRVALKAASAIVAVGIAITAVGVASFYGGSLIGPFVAGLQVVSAAVGAAVSALKFLTLTVGGAMIRAVASGTAAFFRMSAAGKAVAASITGAFSGLAVSMKDTFKGVGSAIWNGDFKGATEIGLAGLKVAWVQATNFLGDVWNTVSTYFVGSIDAIGVTLSTTFVSAAAEVQKAWVSNAAGMADAWDHAVTWVANSLQSMGVYDSFTLMADVWNSAVAIIQDAWGATCTFLSDLWNDFTGTMTGIWNATVETIVGTGVLISEAWADVCNATRTIWAETCDALSSAWSGFVDFLGPALDPFREFFGGVVDAMTSSWDAMVSAFRDAWKWLTSSMIADFRGAQEWIAKGIAYIVAKISGKDAGEAMKAVEEQFKSVREDDARKNAARAEARDRGIEQRNANAGSTIAGIEAGKNSSIQGTQAGLEDRRAARQAELDAAAEASRKRLADAQAEFAKAQADAKARADQALKDAKKGRINTPQAGYDFSGAGKQATGGAFSAVAASRLGGSGVVNQIAANTAATARYTREIANRENTFTA